MCDCCSLHCVCPASLLLLLFLCFFFYKWSTSFQAKKAFVIIYYIFVLLHFLCYVLVRLEGIMVLCFVRWYSFWFYNMYLQVTFFLFLKSYYLKWPGCFNGCKCGDECKVQVYPPLDPTDWERVDQLNLLLLINMRFFYKRHKRYIIIYIYIYIYIYICWWLNTSTFQVQGGQKARFMIKHSRYELYDSWVASTSIWRWIFNFIIIACVANLYLKWENLI